MSIMIYYSIFLSTVRVSTMNTKEKTHKIHFIFICKARDKVWHASSMALNLVFYDGYLI